MDFIHSFLVKPFADMAAAPDFLLQVLWEGLVSGVLYALIALGFVLIYKSSRIFNFAQGIMVVFAALTLVGLHEKGVPAWAGRSDDARRHVHSGDGDRAGGASPAGQPARHHPVHGDDRHNLVPDRPWRVDLRRRKQGHDHRRNLVIPTGIVRVRAGRRIAAYRAEGCDRRRRRRDCSWSRCFSSSTTPRWAAQSARLATITRRRLSVGISLSTIWVLVWFIAGIIALATGIVWGARAGVSFALEVIAYKALPVLMLGGLESVLGAIVGGLMIGILEKLFEIYWGQPLFGGNTETWFAFVLRADRAAVPAAGPVRRKDHRAGVRGKLHALPHRRTVQVELQGRPRPLSGQAGFLAAAGHPRDRLDRPALFRNRVCVQRTADPGADLCAGGASASTS